MSVVDARLMQAFASEDFSGSSNCVELVALRAVFGRSLVGLVDASSGYSASSGAISSMNASVSAAGLNSAIKQPVSVKTRSWPDGR